MDSTPKYIAAVIFFYVSVLLWGIRGLFVTFFICIKSPLTVFTKSNRSELPKCANDPELGVHDSIVVSTASLNDSSAVRLKIKYVANGKKSNPLMLCVHGFPECWYSWRHQLTEFSKKYYVVAIDLPGYGGSDKPKNMDTYKVANLVDNIADVIQGLGYEKATVVAHDWGGALAWTFAAKHSHLCDKVVIMNAPNAVGFQKGFTFKQYCMSWYMFFFQLPWIPEFLLGAHDYIFLSECFRGQWGVKNKGSISSDDVDVYKHSLHTWEARNRAISYYRVNNMLSRLNDKKPVGPKPTITSPVLLIWGTEDTALSLELAVKSASISPLVTVEFVDGASHWVQQDNPGEVNRLMWNFLS